MVQGVVRAVEVLLSELIPLRQGVLQAHQQEIEAVELLEVERVEEVEAKVVVVTMQNLVDGELSLRAKAVLLDL
jgi:hypothetical protein